MKNAVIYARSASPDKQATHAQLEICREYARTHGYNVVAEFSDNGYSRMNFDRPAFTAMNNSRDKWATLIVYRLDKLSRNHNDCCKYRKALRDEGKQIVSISEPQSDEIFAILEGLQGLCNNHKREVQSK
ncbi:MAG: recombinase family protein [Clostridia bacterium]|nr:recombinase family protein [Clostridia bacterium]